MYHKSKLIILTLTIIISTTAGCSGKVKKTEDNTYLIKYKSYRSEDDARKQAMFKATMECTGHGKKVNLLSEEKSPKRIFEHVIEFECVD